MGYNSRVLATDGWIHGQGMDEGSRDTDELDGTLVVGVFGVVRLRLYQIIGLQNYHVRIRRLFFVLSVITSMGSPSLRRLQNLCTVKQKSLGHLDLFVDPWRQPAAGCQQRLTVTSLHATHFISLFSSNTFSCEMKVSLHNLKIILIINMSGCVAAIQR